MRGRNPRHKLPPLPEGWERLEELELTGSRALIPGREFKVAGERGTFRFLHAIRSAVTGTTWVTAYGGDPDPNGYRAVRSFHPEAITRTLRKSKLRAPRPRGGES